MDHADLFNWDGQPDLSSDGTHSEHKYITISQDAEGNQMTEEAKTDNELAQLIEDTSKQPNTSPVLHFIVTLQKSREGLLPYTSQTYNALQSHWHMTDPSFSHIYTGTYMTFRPDVNDPGWRGIRITSLPVRSAHFVVIHNLQKQQTFAILLYSTAKSAEMYENIIDAIQSIKSHAHTPEALSLMFIMLHMTQTEQGATWLTRDFSGIQHSLMANSYLVAKKQQTPPDTTNAPGALTSLICAVAVLSAGQKELSNFIDFIKEILKDSSMPDDTALRLVMENHIKMLGHRSTQLKAHVDKLNHSAQALIQFVYATLQQQDNKLNHRYAANVNVITAITLVFLPGTFVATLFSSSFWDFRPDSNGPVVSGWVWLYFVLTAVLTFIVLAIWRGFAVLKQLVETWKGVMEDGLINWFRRNKTNEDVETGHVEATGKKVL